MVQGAGFRPTRARDKLGHRQGPRANSCFDGAVGRPRNLGAGKDRGSAKWVRTSANVQALLVEAAHVLGRLVVVNHRLLTPAPPSRQRRQGAPPSRQTAEIGGRFASHRGDSALVLEWCVPGGSLGRARARRRRRAWRGWRRRGAWKRRFCSSRPCV